MSHWTVKIKNTAGITAEYKVTGDTWTLLNVAGGATGLIMGSLAEKTELMSTLQKLMHCGAHHDTQEFRLTHQE